MSDDMPRFLEGFLVVRCDYVCGVLRVGFCDTGLGCG